MGRFKKVSVVAGILVFLLIINVAVARAAKAAGIEIDKIETDLFPDITVAMKVVSNGAPVSGLTVLDFKLNEEIRHKVLSDETFIIQPFTVNEDDGGSGKYTILYKAQPLNKSDREDLRIFKAEVSHKNNLYTASWNYTVRAISDRERARAYFTRGSAFLFDKKYPDARDKFKKALEYEPANKEARDGLVKCEEEIAVSLYTDEAAKPFETRNYTRAKEAFNAVLKASPEHAKAKECLAKIASFEETRTQASLDLEKAKKSFEEEKAKPQDKQNFETILTGIQNILNNAGEYQAAKTLYDEASKLSKDIRQRQAKFEEGKKAFDEKDLDKAKKVFQDMDDFPGCKDMLAKIYATENKSGDIEKHFSEGKSLFEEKKYAGSREKCAIVLGLDRDHKQAAELKSLCDAYLLLAEANQQLKEQNLYKARDKSNEALRIAEQLDPAHPIKKELLATCQEALKSVCAYLAKEAQAAFDKENFDQARAHLNEALKLEPGNANALALLKKTDTLSRNKGILLKVVIGLAGLFLISAIACYAYMRSVRERKCPRCGKTVPKGQTCPCLGKASNETIVISGKSANRQPDSSYLTVESGPYTGQTFTLVVPETFIGRDDTNNVCLTADKFVSKRHAKIRRAAGGYIMSDFGSTNETRVNGKPISTSEHLADGDEIAMGETVFTLHVR